MPINRPLVPTPTDEQRKVMLDRLRELTEKQKWELIFGPGEDIPVKDESDGRT